MVADRAVTGLPSGFHARKGGPGRNSRPSRRPAHAFLKRRNVRRRSRGALRPSFAIKLPPSKQRAQGRPGACCTRGPVCDFAQTKTCTRAYRAARAFRPSLRNGFTAYFVLFPENGSFASVVDGTFPANLAPAPRRPNHTTSPYAPSVSVYHASCVHRISPRVRDDGQRAEATAPCRFYGRGLAWRSQHKNRAGLNRIPGRKA